MKLKVIKQIGTWKDAYFCMKKTIMPELEYEKCKDPDLVMKRRIAYAQHSPCRVVSYLIEVEIPNKTQNHVVRHNQGVDWFVSTLRSDLKDIQDIEVSRLTPRTVVFQINLLAIFHIVKTRNCKKAEKETQEFAFMLKEKLMEFDNALNFKSLWETPCLTCREGAFGNCYGDRRSDKYFL